MDFEYDNEVESDDDISIASGSSHTSYDTDGSMRSASPASIATIDSTMQFFREEHGRLLHNYPGAFYHLPADAEELDRQGLLSFYIPLLDFNVCSFIANRPATRHAFKHHRQVCSRDRRRFGPQ